MPLNYKPLIKSGFGVGISGQHVYVESGVPVVISGQPVTISGDHVFVESGVYVIADIAESGMGVQIQSGAHVQISGQHVFVESGVHVIADIAESGMGVQIQSGAHVQISGQHVFVESGVHVVTQPDIAVSGTVSIQSGVIDVLEYGYHILSGEWRPKAVCDSGEIVVCSGAHVQISGQHVFVESGVHVTTQPDIGVSGTVRSLVSGDHIFVESGAYGTVDIFTPTEINICSGSNPLTLPTQAAVPLCSGECISLIVKAVGDNGGDLYFGGHAAGEHPLCLSGSEQGFKTAPGEAFNLDIDNRGKVWVCACTSGDKVTFISVV